jgi:hypothetical protein
MSNKEDEETLKQVREIMLPDGSIFTLSFNELFCEKVRKYFELDVGTELTDEHYKSFFAASLAGV